MSINQKRIFIWADEPSIPCTSEDINKIIEDLEREELEGKITKIPFYHARRIMILFNTYCIAKTDNSVNIRVFRSHNDHHQYIFNAHKAEVKDSPENHLTGMQAYEIIETMFQKKYNKESMFVAIAGGLKNREIYRAIRACVPKPVGMIGQFCKGKILDHIFKADISSAYPSEGSKMIPTLINYKEEKGYVEPTEEYPFAFYLNSHHLKIYNELDTRSWAKQKDLYTRFDETYDDVHPDNEVTILCQKSFYPLTPIFAKLYKKKNQGDQQAKLCMNACIGMFQKENNPRLSFVAAVVIARCCDRIMNLAKQIRKQGNKIVLIATDSIIWQGKKFAGAVNTKTMGSFTYELEDGRFFGAGEKAYQIEDKNGNCITKYAGMKNGAEKDNMKFGDLPCDKGSKRYVINNDGKVDVIDYL